MAGEHLTEEGEFKSDKYEWCPPGFVPFKLADEMAQPFLWGYADVRRTVDQEFADDLPPQKTGSSGNQHHQFTASGMDVGPSRAPVNRLPSPGRRRRSKNCSFRRLLSSRP